VFEQRIFKHLSYPEFRSPHRLLDDERYATTWRGVFPRFLLAGAALVATYLLIQVVLESVFPITSFRTAIPVTNQLNVDIQDIASILYFPFTVFVVFYIVSRVRIDLSRDYARVAASILVGALAVALLFSAFEAIAGNFGNVGPVFEFLQLLGSLVSTAIELTFIGFVAALVSFKRRM
jgi:hypothetical protein